jgi:hypothetical protein
MSNGLSKTTFARRLDDVNDLMLKSVRGRWPDDTLCVLDVAVSSGVSTLELAEAMRREGLTFKIIGTDVSVEGSLLSYGRPFHVLCDGRGKALQFEILGYPVSNYVGTGVTFCRRCVPVLAGRALFRLLTSLPVRRLAVPACKPIRLLTEGCQRDPDVTIVEEDLFNPKGDGFTCHVIRAANILNPSIFSRTQLAQAIDHLRHRLKPRGILFIVRTEDDGSNNGGCYELQGNGAFRRLDLLGNGCDIEWAVLGGP